MAIAEIPKGPLALPGGDGSAVRPNEALGVFVRPEELDQIPIPGAVPPPGHP